MMVSLMPLKDLKESKGLLAKDYQGLKGLEAPRWHAATPPPIQASRARVGGTPEDARGKVQAADCGFIRVRGFTVKDDLSHLTSVKV